jgi:hypothetical protein
MGSTQVANIQCTNQSSFDASLYLVNRRDGKEVALCDNIPSGDFVVVSLASVIGVNRMTYDKYQVKVWWGRKSGISSEAFIYAPTGRQGVFVIVGSQENPEIRHVGYTDVGKVANPRDVQPSPPAPAPARTKPPKRRDRPPQADPAPVVAEETSKESPSEKNPSTAPPPNQPKADPSPAATPAPRQQAWSTADLSEALFTDTVKSVLLINRSSFDATLYLVDVVHGGEYILGNDLRPGDSVVFPLASVRGVSGINGSKYAVKVSRGHLTAISNAAFTYAATAPSIRKATFIVLGSRENPLIQHTGVTDIEVATTALLNDSTFKLKCAMLKDKRVPDPPYSLTEKERWIQCVVKNQTQFPIEYLGPMGSNLSTFVAGPNDVGAFQQLVFSCYNDNGSNDLIGRLGFRVKLDQHLTYDFSIDWNAPSDRAELMALISPSPKPREWNGEVSSQGNAFTSEESFRGLQGKTTQVEWQLHFLAIPGVYVTYVVSEVRLQPDYMLTA